METTKNLKKWNGLNRLEISTLVRQRLWNSYIPMFCGDAIKGKMRFIFHVEGGGQLLENDYILRIFEDIGIFEAFRESSPLVIMCRKGGIWIEGESIGGIIFSDESNRIDWPTSKLPPNDITDFYEDKDCRLSFLGHTTTEIITSIIFAVDFILGIEKDLEV